MKRSDNYCFLISSGDKEQIKLENFGSKQKQTVKKSFTLKISGA